MATITQTVEETLTFTAKPPQKLKNAENDKKKKVKFQPAGDFFEQRLALQKCPPGCPDCKRMTAQLQCPPDCKECMEPRQCPPNCMTCKDQNSKTVPRIFNAIGIIIAVLATYMIVTTESHLYLVFWVVYSVLRRMMTRSKPRVKTE